MAALFVYVCFILTLTLVARQAVAVHYVLKGKEAILSPALPKAPDDILWKHNGDKVITFDSAEERVFPPFEGRVTLGWGTAELTIADVGYEDSGEYELEAFIRDKPHRSQYMLKVLDKVSKPVIRCEINEESGNSTSVRRATLLCSSDSNTPEALTFKWNLEGKSQPGQTLTIALGNEYDHLEYSCTATNPKHAETGIYMAKDCYTAGSSKALDIIVPIVIALLILLAFCIFPFIFRHQIKRACLKQGKNDDLEKQMTVADGNNKDEGSPLMGDIHRQETFASKQPLIQQNVIASSQSQEIANELEEPRPSRKVKKRSKKFTNCEQMESQTEEENDTDTVEMATSQPASPIRNGQVGSEGETHYTAEGRNDADSDHSSQYHDAMEQTEQQVLGEHESRGQTDSEGEPDVTHSDHAPKTNVSEDSSSIYSGQEEAAKASEQAELLSHPHLQSSAPQEHKDLQLTKMGLAEFNEKIRPEPIVDQEAQQDPSDEREPDFIHPEPTKPVSLPQLAHHSDMPLFDVDSQSEPVEPESKEQVSSDEESSPASEDKDPQGDDSHNESVTSEHEEAEESKLSNDSQMPPAHSELSESPPPSQSSPPAGKDSQTRQVDDVKTDPDEESNTVDTVEKQRGSSSSDSLASEPTTAESGELGLTNEQQSSESPPQSPLQHRPASVQGSQSESDEPEDKEKTSPVEQAKPDPVEKDPQEDSDHESVRSDTEADRAEDVAVNDAQPSPPESDSPVDDVSSQTDQNQNHHLGPNVEMVKELESSTDSSCKESEELKQTSATELTPSADSELPELQSQSPSSDPQRGQTDSEGEPDVHDSDHEHEPKTDAAGDSSSINSGQEETTNAPEQAESPPQSPLQHCPASVEGSQSESDEPEEKEKTSPVEQTKPDPVGKDPQDDSDHESLRSDNEAERAKDAALKDAQPSPPESDSPGSEKESDESTHPTASALSQRTHNKETKDTDAENASSAQVSEETKDNTDKESDSSGSEQINEASKLKEGQQ